jgi:RNA polymerase sigma-70 factor (ECF subfamily)
MIDTLFQVHTRALAALFRRRLGNDVDTEDLVHEVYLRITRANVDKIQNLEAYLFTVAENLAKKHAKQQSRRRRQSDLDEPDIQERLAVAPNLDAQLHVAVCIEQLARVVQELPLKCQIVVTMHYFHEMTYEEIATELEISTHMVKKYVVNALMHCRKRMAELR